MVTGNHLVIKKNTISKEKVDSLKQRLHICYELVLKSYELLYTKNLNITNRFFIFDTRTACFAEFISTCTEISKYTEEHEFQTDYISLFNTISNMAKIINLKTENTITMLEEYKKLKEQHLENIKKLHNFYDDQLTIRNKFIKCNF